MTHEPQSCTATRSRRRRRQSCWRSCTTLSASPSQTTARRLILSLALHVLPLLPLTPAEPRGILRFARRCLTAEPDWSYALSLSLSLSLYLSAAPLFSPAWGRGVGRTTLRTHRRSEKPLSRLEVRATGVIEDSPDALQCDFANRYVGGGVIMGVRLPASPGIPSQTRSRFRRS
jgi:hypothetical protein